MAAPSRGARVVAAAALRSAGTLGTRIPAGTRGTVDEVDSDGDVCVDFHGFPHMLWVGAAQLGELRALPPAAPPPAGGDSAAAAAAMRRALPVRRPAAEISVATLNLYRGGPTRDGFETEDGADPDVVYAHVPPEFRTWARRRDQLRDVIFGLDADVLCTQEAEVATFAAEFGFLAGGGYAAVAPSDGRRTPPRSPPRGASAAGAPAADAAAGDKHAGLAKCAILYKPARLELVWQEHRSRVVLASLRHRPSGRMVYVVCCHLEGAPRAAAARLSQVRSALKHLRARQRLAGEDPARAAVVVAGDFNAGAGSAAYECLRRGGLRRGFRDPWAPEEELVPKDFAHDYALCELLAAEAEEEAGRATFVGAESPAAVVDHIFYSRRTLRAAAVRRPPLAAQLLPGIPNAWYPSDHVPVGGVFELRDGGDDAAADPPPDVV